MRDLGTQAASGPRPPDLHFTMTGETFEFITSAKHGDGVFRFRWTLAPGKKGPPEHIHAREHETFAVMSGTLRIWLDGMPQDVGAGQIVTVEPGVRHRFFNPTQSDVVVVVSLDGAEQEDVLVPLAHHLGGSTRMRIADVFVMLVHTDEVRASEPPSRIGRGLMSALARVLRWCGARPLPRSVGW